MGREWGGLGRVGGGMTIDECVGSDARMAFG